MKPNIPAGDLRQVSIVSLEPLPASLLVRLPQLYRAYADDVPVERLRVLAISRLEALLGSRDCSLIVARHLGKMRGLSCWRSLSDACECFGFPVGQVEIIIADGDYFDSRNILQELISRTLSSCRDCGIKYLTMQVNADELAVLHTVEEAGFDIIKRGITLSLRPQGSVTMPKSDQYDISLCEHEDLEEIAQIATAEASANCAYIDPLLPAALTNRLARTFAMNSCRSADVVIAVSAGGVLQAYASCRMDVESSSALGVGCGRIDNLGVRPERLKESAFDFVQQAALSWLAQHDVRIAELAFQSSHVVDHGLTSNVHHITGVNLTLRKMLNN